MCSSAHDCSGWRAFMSEAKFADRTDNLVGQYRAMISFYQSILTCEGVCDRIMKKNMVCAAAESDRVREQLRLWGGGSEQRRYGANGCQQARLRLWRSYYVEQISDASFSGPSRPSRGSTSTQCARL